MKTKKINLVMSDIDGTILDDNHQLDDQLKETLHLLQTENIPFVLASARSPKGMYQIAEDLEITKEPLACYNGALILKDADKENYTPLFSHELDNKEVEQIIQILKKDFPEISVNLYAGQDWYVQKHDDWVKIEADITKDEPIEYDLLELIQESNLAVHKLLMIGTAAEIEKVHKHFEYLNLDTSLFYLSKDNYLEVTHKDVTKERALLELAEYFDVSLKNVLTIGDNFNDIPMLRLAGIGVAMENAPLEIQKNADVITQNNNENGATKAFRKYVLKQ